jgi:chemotaxis protein MotA
MFVIIGGVIVMAAVLVGFSMAGGKPMSLLHLSEFVTIGGSTVGALIIMSPMKVIKDIVRGIMTTLKGSPYGKPTCLELFRVLYALARVVRQEGALGLEAHLANPDESSIFKQYPKINNNHHLRDFLCGGLSLLADGKVTSEQLTLWLDEEVKVIDREHHAAVDALTKTADALPGFGIVAAVLGIVVTMQAIGGPVDVIGYKVGAALVGTFLGILMAYGFFAPLAARMGVMGDQETVFLQAVCAAVVSMNDGASPRDVLTRSRRLLGTDTRPTPQEMYAIFNEANAAG